jgi:phage-related protein
MAANTRMQSLGKVSGLVSLSDYKTDTFRAGYVVRFEHALYVLHCFQKKSTSGTRTAKTDVEMIERRLKAAQADYEARYGQASQKRE